MERMRIPLRELKFAEEGDTMTLAGYGSVFGNVDSDGDVIARGAFTKSLSEHKSAGTMPKMLLEHGWSQSPLPIGVWGEIAEDEKGLRVSGRLIPTTEGKDTYIALKEGAVDGLSVGFTPVDIERGQKPGDPRRTFKTVNLVEVSVVGFPANGKARVSNVKSAQDILTIRDLEDSLREAGYSKSEALAISSRFQAKTDRSDSGADEAIVAGIDRLLSTIRA